VSVNFNHVFLNYFVIYSTVHEPVNQINTTLDAGQQLTKPIAANVFGALIAIFKPVTANKRRAE
jgi:hypothetical protein